MSPLPKAYYVLRYLGPGFVGTRLRLKLQRLLGHDRRVYASRAWESISLAQITTPGTPADAGAYADFKRGSEPPFLFPLGEPPDLASAECPAAFERRPALAERIRLLAQDRCVLLFHTPTPGPVDWYANELTSGRGVRDRPWYEIPDFLDTQGDVRTLWDASRAAWAFDLARGKAHGIPEADAGLFWRWVDSWRSACPPFQGTQWKCGQEASVRLIALAIGFWVFAEDAATTPQRWVQFARLAWATGYRVYHQIDYAVSQKNNHALSEACGLLLIGTLFPEFRDAPRWLATGRRVLARELRRQVYADGSYVQHSLNYQRVMLQTATLALRLGEVAGERFDADVYERIGRAAAFTYQMMEPANGRVPNYGNNDGAWVLPLSECDFRDYRPAVQAAGCLADRRRRLPAGPWDEDLKWLFGQDALRSADQGAEKPASRAFDAGGYYTLRRAQSWAMTRCHTYRDRPGQRDALHVDLWWRGLNVLRDCGTYQYFVPRRDDLSGYFTSRAAHNTIEIDGAQPDEKTTRFLWFPWPRCVRRRYDADKVEPICFEGESRDYDRAPWRILHRRTIISPREDLWIVVDDLLGDGEHAAVLRWHLIDAPYEHHRDEQRVSLTTDAGPLHLSVAALPAAVRRFEIVRGRDKPGAVQGFCSEYYGQRRAIPTLEIEYAGSLPARLLTIVSDAAVTATMDRDESDACQLWRCASADRSAALRLAAPSRTAPSVFEEWRESRERTE